jgi:DNA-binding response OmpR family regulator
LWLKPHLARLREKLVTTGAPIPVAVRGVGYILEEHDAAD